MMLGYLNCFMMTSLANCRLFVKIITKPKQFFMGALFTRNRNKTNNKQHVNRGYNSESGHHYLKNPPKRRVFAFWGIESNPFP
ncbi:hypothetical protein B9081_004375 [Citrobacter werkmanii]|nr:hypothetical protein B9081_004375 [Citrobacter werkmanii]